MSLAAESQDRIGTAARLKRLKGEIISVWEDRARAEVFATRDKDSETVQDELVLFLDALIRDLTPEVPAPIEEEKRAAILHGQQRSGLTNYTLIQVLHEYALLREVLIDVLTCHGPLTEEERRTIHRAVDDAIKIAGNEFANAEKANLKVALARAEQSNKDLDQFAAVVAHDLRGPLATVSGFTELLQHERSLASPTAKDVMDRIQLVTQRLIEMIDGVLDYARLSSASVQLEVVDSNDAVQAATQNLKAQLTETGGQINHSEMPVVRANLPLLTQVFQNLFSNSLKFHDEGTPVVQVKFEDKGAFWEFVVSDNGPGFDPRHKAIIFEFQKRSDTSSSHQGQGIGLATCRRAIELHGGTIRADSELGKGATFYFTLPK